MGAYADQVKRLTSDPGARYLAGVADELAEQLSGLQAQIDKCCGGDPPGLRASLTSLEAKYGALAESHRALEVKYEALERSYAALSRPGRDPEPSPETPR